MRKALNSVALLMLFVLVACVRKDAPIRVGHNHWIGYESVVIANSKGFFERAGVNVKLITYESVTEQIEAYRRGELDFLFSSVYEVLALANLGEKPKVVYVTDFSDGSDALVAKRELGSIPELRHKNIGVEIGSVSHFTFIRALQMHNLSEDDVRIINMSVVEAERAFLKGELDAVATWEPHVSRLLEVGHVLFSSRDMPGEIVDTLSVNSEFFARRRSDTEKFLAAFVASTQWIEDNSNEAEQLLATSLKISPPQVQKALSGVKILKLLDNKVQFGNSEKPGPLYNALMNFSAFMQENRLVTHTVDANEILDNSLVRALGEK